MPSAFVTLGTLQAIKGLGAAFNFVVRGNILANPQGFLAGRMAGKMNSKARTVSAGDTAAKTASETAEAGAQVEAAE